MESVSNILIANQELQLQDASESGAEKENTKKVHLVMHVNHLLMVFADDFSK